MKSIFKIIKQIRNKYKLFLSFCQKNISTSSNSVAVGNMHSVTSNAVANGLSNINNQLNGYNQSIYIPSPPLKTALKNSFLNATDYSLFSGRNTAEEEMGWYGFKHNGVKGGLAIILNVRGGLTLGMGGGNPDDWTYRRLIYF